MARPNWEYIRVDVLLPEHPKLDSLSAAAKWTLIELWCWCGQHRTDGFVRDAKWPKFGTPAVRTALAENGLAERVDGGWQMHDFTGPNGHQRSRAEIDELSARRADAGRKGGKARSKTEASASASAEQQASKTQAEAEAEAEADKNPPARERAAPQGAGRATRLPASFTVTPAMTAWAAENTPHINTEFETAKFRDYWNAESGVRAAKRDWEAAWRNWMRRAIPNVTPLAMRPTRQQETDELFDRAMRRAELREGINGDAERDRADSAPHRRALPAATD